MGNSVRAMIDWDREYLTILPIFGRMVDKIMPMVAEFKSLSFGERTPDTLEFKFCGRHGRLHFDVRISEQGIACFLMTHFKPVPWAADFSERGRAIPVNFTTPDIAEDVFAELLGFGIQ